ncbi:hypothetical protein N0V82_002266 [Gnomoniopsis sp. IMI 355080]|nr:hypothetical protein N0V82_002266 [Gnomoniopsis sp. IMI 355080]
MRSILSFSLILLASQALASPLGALQSRQDSVPSVDLGYEVHTGTENSTGNYYIFSNVPYADQPVGDKRFQKVGLPSGSSSTVNNGSTDQICYQAYPQWIIEEEAEAYGLSDEEMEEILYSAAGQTEACLLLNVYVPTGVFASNSSEAPVLIWIHGGGFTYGSKDGQDPAGIIARSTLNDSDGIIVVNINYRLGMFGWLGGGGATPNLGLYDQLVAFEWVQQYISLFGGNPEKITVMGESAGAASILHHITSYGGNTTLPFQQGIIQSPAFQANLNLTEGYEKTLAEASNITGASITSIAELSALDAATLQLINFDAVLSSGEGFFTYGPAPDGTYVPALPQVLLYEGRFNSDVNVIAAHNSLEAAPFVNSSISTEADVIQALEMNYPEASNATITYILDVLYPASDYSSEFLRAVQIASDSMFSCSTRFLAVALGNQTYNYLFAVPPGYHAEDVSYTFFDGDTTTLDDGLAVIADLAYALQDYIVGFTLSGNPNDSPAGPALNFPIYGSNATVLEFAYTGLLTTHDDMDNDRCPWWQQAYVQGLI